MLKCSLYDYYRFKIICTVRHALRTVNIKALLLHALHRTIVIKYMSLLFITSDCYEHMKALVSWRLLMFMILCGYVDLLM